MADITVALYARVSTSDQNCSMQLAELREYCERRSWSVFSEYIDTGWSGRRSDRPEFLRLMGDVAKHRFDAVLVWKLDRFGRSVVDLNTNVQRLKTAGVRFIAITQGIDTDQSNPTANLLLQVLAAVAEFEAEVTRERVKAGMDQAKRRGTRSGNPIGRPSKVFRRDEVIEMRKSGATLRQIAQRFKIGMGTILKTCSETPARKPA